MDLVKRVSDAVNRKIAENDPLNYRLVDYGLSAEKVMAIAIGNLFVVSVADELRLMKELKKANQMADKMIASGPEVAASIGRKEAEFVGQTEEEWIAALRGSEMSLGLILQPEQIEDQFRKSPAIKMVQMLAILNQSLGSFQ